MQLIVILLVTSVTLMATTVIAPALPIIAAAFLGEDPGGIRSRMLLTAPALVTIFAAPLAGFWGDHWKRVPIVVMGLVLFTLFGTAGLWINDLHVLMVSRFLLGIAMGMLMSSSSALIGDYYEGPVRAKVMGYQGMSNSLGGVVFITLGGALSALSWRAPFAVYGFGILMAGLAFLYLPEPLKHKSHGGAGAPGQKSTRWSRIAFVYLTGFLGITSFFLIPVNVPFLLRERFDMVGVSVGLVMASSTLTAATSSMLFSRLLARLGRERVFAITFVCMSLAMWIISWAHSLPWFLVGLLCHGIGLGLLFPNASGSVLEYSAPQMRGRVMGFMSSFFFLGQFMSPIFTGLVKNSMGSLDAVFKSAALLVLLLALVYGVMSTRATGTSAGVKG